jgi:hypothetical protein
MRWSFIKVPVFMTNLLHVPEASWNEGGPAASRLLTPYAAAAARDEGPARGGYSSETRFTEAHHFVLDKRGAFVVLSGAAENTISRPLI